MSTTLLVNATPQKLTATTSLLPASRRAALNTSHEKSAVSTKSAAEMSLPEDIVTLSTSNSSDSAKKKVSQPVTPDEKRALLDPNVSFSVYG